MEEELLNFLSEHKGEREALIPVLQMVQERAGYISPQVVSLIAKFLRISESEIFGVASFYAQFRFTPQGKHRIKVCLGTACYVKGGARILETFERELGIPTGGTTDDLQFSLERVACFGCCALAPVVVVNKEVYSKMTPRKVKEILDNYSRI